MQVKSKKIGYYQNKNITDTKKDISIDNFLTGIKDGKWEDNIHALRRAPQNEQDNLKKSLPCVTTSGTFKERTDNTIEAHSGYIAIDIDKQPELTALEVRNLISNDHLFYAGFLSCRGEGVCGIVKIDPKAHKESYLFMSRYLYKKYNLQVDPSCGNLSRIRFVSYDPDMFLNENSTVCPAKPELKKDKKPLPKYKFDKTDFDRIINDITTQNVDITEQYNDWVFTALALISKFGEDGRDYFHAISEQNAGYDYDAAEAKFNHLLSTTENKVPIDWFYYQIEKHGLVAYGKGTEDFLMQQAVLPEDEREEGLDQEVLERVLNKASLVTKIKFFLKSKYKDYIKNTFTEDLTADNIILTEDDYNTLYLSCKERVDDKTTFDLIWRILHSDFVVKSHPFKDYLSKWDENPPENPTGHIDKIIAALTTDTPYSELFIKKWLVAMIASALGTPSELVLVFCGPQGTGKTEWFRRILPDELLSYRAALSWDNSKDEIIRMSRNLIMIDDEMGGKSQREEKQIKKIASIDKEQLRGSYKRTDEYYKRTAIFCGTTNDEWILSDPTGNRRFLPVFIKAMNHELYNSVDKGLLFYELYLEYLCGYNYKLTPEDKFKLAEASARFEKPHTEEELVDKFFTLPDGKNETVMMNATEIMMYLKARVSGIQFKVENIGRALQKAGFVRKQKKIKGTAIWRYTICINVPEEFENEEI